MRAAVVRLIDELVADLAQERAQGDDSQPQRHIIDTTITRLAHIKEEAADEGNTSD